MIKHLLLVLFLLTNFVSAEGPYRPPNMKKELFNVRNLKIDKISKAALFTGLICVARDFDALKIDFDAKKHEVDYQLRSNALAIAGRLAPNSDTFKDVADELKSRGQTLIKNNTTKSDIAFKIYRGIRVLMWKKENQDNMKCASYCIDIALRLAPESQYSKRLKEYQEDTGTANWKDMLGAPVAKNPQKKPTKKPTTITRKPTTGFFIEPQNEFKPRSETVPGGLAAKFATTHRGAYGLAVRKLSIGRHAGVASSISATAMRSPSTKGIEFHIDQKVGNKTGNSLEAIKKLMRVRHEETGRSPSGYKVKIALTEKNSLLDGTSTGAAMAIVIDSLFTGRELDDRFAIAGAITRHGEVTPIGGVVGKIRGAGLKGCDLVGVPHGNIEGVSDVYTLDGIGKITTIQIFSFKTLDEAIAVASKAKPEHVQQAIAEFRKIADRIKLKGEVALKDAQVIGQLKSVISKMPNHQSALLLLKIAKGEQKKTLSRGASFHQINLRLSDLRPNLRRMMFNDPLRVTLQDRQQIRYAVTEMKKIRSKIDSRLKSYNNATLNVFEILGRGRIKGEDGKKFPQRFKDAWEKAETERQKLMKDPAVITELAD